MFKCKGRWLRLEHVSDVNEVVTEMGNGKVDVELNVRMMHGGVIALRGDDADRFKAWLRIASKPNPVKSEISQELDDAG